MRENDPYRELDLRQKLLHFLQDIWPSVYRTINGLFWGILRFLGDTLSGLWRR